ncbi:hypothetical protein ABT337_25480 [Saccharopolyspora hirsuta]|uniref:Uncharacterized protein n=1 Tax=Saccharopolyspora hirsuta TaxID=1837 RepID=A0A5M7BM03_SACHI|nr:hypothetical protein [Saccharopolyspora hirsuta]KAA5829168.1 hypothetical protein F1721_26235 [Saccharopolyspora hirsuta]
MAGAWEQAVNSVVPQDSPVRDRDDLAGPGSPSWISEVGYQIVYDGSASTANWDVYRSAQIQSTSDVRVSHAQESGGKSPDTHTNLGTLYIWARVNWPLFEGEATTFGQLTRVGTTSLDPLVHPPQANSVTSIPSFRETADLLANARKFLEDKADEMAKLANEVGSGDKLAGATAQSLQQTLHAFGSNLNTFAGVLGRDTVVNQLRKAGATLEAQVNALLQAFQNWRGSKLWSPVAAVKEAFDKYSLENLKADGGTLTNMEHAVGSVLNSDFIVNLDTEAKSLWMDNYAVLLDPAAQTMINAVERDYTAALLATPGEISFGGGSGGAKDPQSQLDDYQQQVQDQQEKYQQQMQDQLDQQQQQQEEYQQQLQDQQQQQQEDLQSELPDQQSQDLQQQGSDLPENSGGSTELDTGGDPGGDGEDFDLPDTDVSDETGQNLPTGGSSTSEDGFGTNQGGAFTPPPTTLGSFGSAQINPSALSKMDPDGFGGSTVVGPDGTMVTKPDGTPLSVPPGSKINPDGTVTKADGSLLRDPSGNPIKVPPGSSIQPSLQPGSVVNPDGTVTNADGSLLRDPHGNPVRVPPGSVLHPNSSGSTLYPFGKANLSPDLHTSGSKYGLGSGIGSDTTKRAGGFGSAEIGDPTRRSTVNSSALDEALRKPVTPSTESGPRGLGSKSGANGQTPMMPPPMAGGGAGGDQNRERQRTTWLSEEADTWNTDEGFTTAIGR